MATRYYVLFPDRGGEPYRPLPRHVLRIGDAERDAAAADLGDHYVAGRLTLDELHDRLGQVFAARTHGQLWNVMADLPGAARSRQLAETGPSETGPARAGLAQAGLAEMRPTEAGGEAARPASRRVADEAWPATTADRAGRFAALSLLILAMLIWLFTAYLFARHGAYTHPGPGPWTPPGYPGG